MIFSLNWVISEVQLSEADAAGISIEDFGPQTAVPPRSISTIAPDEPELHQHDQDWTYFIIFLCILRLNWRYEYSISSGHSWILMGACVLWAHPTSPSCPPPISGPNASSPWDKQKRSAIVPVLVETTKNEAAGASSRPNCCCFFKLVCNRS